MSIINNGLLLASEAGAAAGYQISRSLRFNSSDSAFLSRVPSTPGNRKTWSFSWWMKRGALSTGAYYTILDALGGGTGTSNINIPDSNTGNGVLEITEYIGAYNYRLVTTQVFRDPSAWYHCVVAFDTTQSAASNRIKLYVNGVQVTTFSTATYPSQNLDGGINSTNAHNIGRNVSQASRFWDGYLADPILIDGQALPPTSFAETNATTGQWVPKAYTGSYGTNGFRLSFSDNSGVTATTLGKDAAGSNNWTPNNFSVSSGAGNDSLVDTPTSYGTDTGAGGEVRGNYCTLNPLNIAGGALANGNLDLTNTGAGRKVGTIGVSSGKWYWEVTVTSAGDAMIGIMPPSNPASTASSGFLGGVANEYGYYGTNGQKYNNSSATAYGATFTNGDVIGVALNMDAGTLIFYKNNTSQGTAFSGLSGTFAPAASAGGSSGASMTLNAGARPFAYTAPSGFKALCDTNLPTPTIAKPSTVMDVKLYTGNGSTQTISGLNFSPDFVWLKSRTNANWHELNDTVRGAGKILYSNQTNAEATVGTFTAFNSDGFGVSTTGGDGTNFLNAAMVAWTCDAGSSTVTNNDGSITGVQVRANVSAGFSVVTYTGSGANATVAHGLGVSPGLVIVKRRDTTANWQVRHTSIAAASSIQLNLTNAAASATTVWNSTTPTSTVFSIGTDATVNASGGTYVAYCFAPVAGYSAMGSYTGNGSSDGPAIWLGFRPRWVMVKRSDSANYWIIQDAARNSSNVVNLKLAANGSEAENDLATIGDTSQNTLDFLSNGFKCRTSNAGTNASSGTYLYMAFAESPFPYSRAR